MQFRTVSPFYGFMSTFILNSSVHDHNISYNNTTHAHHIDDGSTYITVTARNEQVESGEEQQKKSERKRARKRTGNWNNVQSFFSYVLNKRGWYPFIWSPYYTECHLNISRVSFSSAIITITSINFPYVGFVTVQWSAWLQPHLGYRRFFDTFMVYFIRNFFSAKLAEKVHHLWFSCQICLVVSMWILFLLFSRIFSLFQLALATLSSQLLSRSLFSNKIKK